MKRLRNKSPLRLTRDAERLISLSIGLSASGSRLEDARWEHELAALCIKLMESGNSGALESALDHTFLSNPAAHDALAEMAEAQAESVTITLGGSGGDSATRDWDLMLLAIPLVAWSKYAVPSGPISGAGLTSLAAITPQLHAHVLAKNARLSVAPFLYSIDQMPRDFSSVRKLALRLGEAAATQVALTADKSKYPDTAPLLADTRFLLAGVAVPSGEALFRWQEQAEARNTRSDCLAHWIEQGRPHLAKMLPGCSFECLLPDAYFVNCRESDRFVRTPTIRAAVAFLESTLKLNPSQLRAVIAGVGETRVDEYRVSFLQNGHAEVVEGIVWPLFGREEEDAEPAPLAEIQTVLKDCKLGAVTALDGLFAPEFCEDCGAPLFADADGEMVHPELPEEVETTASHYH